MFHHKISFYYYLYRLIETYLNILANFILTLTFQIEKIPIIPS